MKKVSKKTAYDIKEASNPKLKASARKNYAKNAEAAMKNKKSPAKQIIDPEAKKREQERRNKMTPNERKTEGEKRFSPTPTKSASMTKKPAVMMKKAPAPKMKKC
jgi:hypothetical protein